MPGAGLVDACAQSLPAGFDQPQTAIGSMTPAGKLPWLPRARAVASTDTGQLLNPIAWPMIAPTCWVTLTWTPTEPAGIGAPLLVTAPMSARAPFVNCAVQVQLSAATQSFSVSDLSTAAQTAL